MTWPLPRASQLALHFKVTHGNADMAKARDLCPDHPEVLMFQKRRLGAAESMFAKARDLASAGDDRTAIKVPVMLVQHL